MTPDADFDPTGCDSPDREFVDGVVSQLGGDAELDWSVRWLLVSFAARNAREAARAIDAMATVMGRRGRPRP